MEYRISVRGLCEFILRSGDLDNREGKGTDIQAMQKGTRLHKKIQKMSKTGYRAEVSLSFVRFYEEYALKIEGRADGIMENESGVTIEEIKGTYGDVEQLKEAVPVHLAQAKCYACLYALQNGLETIGVQMTYGNLDTEQLHRLNYSYTAEELEAWFEELVEAYHRWLELSWQWRKQRNETIRDLKFPYPYRTGQKELISAVYLSQNREKQLFIQAPTGVGKTLSCVYPSVKAMTEDGLEKVFYLTARTVARQAAASALELLRAKGLKLKSIMLTAKEKCCVMDEADCNPVYCPRARGHFDRVNDAVFELLTREDDLTREVLSAQAEQFCVCPFEMMLDASLWVDMIIGDYNYFYDPKVRLKRFFEQGGRLPYVVLVDEAHNLVDRGREMYSAAICKEDVLALGRLVKVARPKLYKALQAVNRQLLELKRQCDQLTVLEHAGALALGMQNLVSAFERALEEPMEPALKKEVLNLYFQVLTFLNIYDLMDEKYVTYGRHKGDGSFEVRLFCVDPSVNLQRCMDQVKSCILFSATLLPVNYYRSLLSGRADDYTIYAQTAFSPKQQLLLVGTDVSSRYTRRNEAEYQKIARYIRLVTAKKQGRYMVFVPSYRMLEDISLAYEEEFPDTGDELVLQTPSMTEGQREAFLEHFQRGADHTIIGFCVMGGIFGEGIDLTGDALIGAIIVGTGIPQITEERRLLMEQLEMQGKNGFDYAYRIPGMNKVLQAAGRVIRTIEDRGVILLLDERFVYRENLELFPREWAHYQTVELGSVEEKVAAFWSDSGIVNDS